MTPFQPGDKVLCIAMQHIDGAILPRDKVYEVKNCKRISLTLKEFDSQEDLFGCHAFVKFDDSKLARAIYGLPE